jgi:hypothetical protein
MKTYRISIAVAFLAFLPLTQAVAANEEASLPVQARAVLEKYCFGCHGARFEVKDYNVLDWKSLTARRPDEKSPYVVPGRPEESALWKRLGVAKNMPPSDPKPSEAEKSLIKQWIASGAPLPRVEPGARRFLSEETVLGLIRDDLRGHMRASASFAAISRSTTSITTAPSPTRNCDSLGRRCPS